MTFFLNMHPPTITHQEKKVTIRNGKPIFYEPPALKDARDKLMAYLYKHHPEEPLKGPIALTVKWAFYKKGAPKLKTTKPDTDNLQKLLKDCMTACGFWKDDAQVCYELVSKIWSPVPGITIEVEEIDD